MKIIRVTNPRAIDLMQDYLLHDDDEFDEGQLEGLLKQMLENTPQNTYFVQAWDGDELKSFVLAIAPPGTGHTFVLQAWVKPGVPKKLTDEIFNRIKIWTEMLGRTSIRMETKRDPDAWNRRWQFEPHSTVMEFDLTRDEKELINGRRIGRNGSTQHSEQETDSDIGSLQPGDSEQDIQSSPTVSGPDGGSTGPGDAGSQGIDGEVSAGPVRRSEPESD